MTLILQRPMKLWMNARLLMAAVLLMSLSACQQSSEEKLMGRWFNGTMSIRFREDGGVVLNSPSGLGIGRYVFNPTVITPTSGTPDSNLTVDMVRNNARTQIEFHIEFLSGDRLKVTNLAAEVPIRNRRNGVPREFAILKRAYDAEPDAPSPRVAGR